MTVAEAWSQASSSQAPSSEVPSSEAQRFPLLTEAGRRLIRHMWEHDHAPRYVGIAGDRLSEAGRERVRGYEEQLALAQRGWIAGQTPGWVQGFAARCLEQVPFYRRRGGDPERFLELPAVQRADLGREPWAFVPDDQPLEDLIVFRTSATTGHPLRIPSHPEAVVRRIPLLRRALATRGVTLEGGAGRVAIVLCCAQRWTVTGAMAASYLGDAGFAKVNLNPADWRGPQDRALYLDALDPEVYTGDPVAFAELAKLPLRSRPKALLSSSQTLLPAHQAELERHFGCPVLDLYSLTEVGPVAVAGPQGWQILPHDLYVEVLGPDGRQCPPGVRGEVALTGGGNPYLPLLRYRTGDQASLDWRGGLPALQGLEGRPPAVFRGTRGQLVHSMDVSTALRPFPLVQFALQQAEDGSLCLRLRGQSVSREAVRRALVDLFGAGQSLILEELPDASLDEGKIVQYTSAWSR